MIFSPKKHEMTNCSKEIRILTRDQMMSGGYIYDGFSWLRDSVFRNCIIQLNSHFRLTLLERISERNSILQDKTFLQQKCQQQEARKEGMINK